MHHPQIIGRTRHYISAPSTFNTPHLVEHLWMGQWQNLLPFKSIFTSVSRRHRWPLQTTFTAHHRIFPALTDIVNGEVPAIYTIRLNIFTKGQEYAIEQWERGRHDLNERKLGVQTLRGMRICIKDYNSIGPTKIFDCTPLYRHSFPVQESIGLVWFGGYQRFWVKKNRVSLSVRVTHLRTESILIILKIGKNSPSSITTIQHSVTLYHSKIPLLTQKQIWLVDDVQESLLRITACHIVNELTARFSELGLTTHNIYLVPSTTHLARHYSRWLLGMQWKSVTMEAVVIARHTVMEEVSVTIAWSQEGHRIDSASWISFTEFARVGPVWGKDLETKERDKGAEVIAKRVGIVYVDEEGGGKSTDQRADLLRDIRLTELREQDENIKRSEDILVICVLAHIYGTYPAHLKDPFLNHSPPSSSFPFLTKRSYSRTVRPSAGLHFCRNSYEEIPYRHRASIFSLSFAGSASLLKTIPRVVAVQEREYTIKGTVFLDIKHRHKLTYTESTHIDRHKLTRWHFIQGNMQHRVVLSAFQRLLRIKTSTFKTPPDYPVAGIVSYGLNLHRAIFFTSSDTKIYPSRTISGSALYTEQRGLRTAILVAHRGRPAIVKVKRWFMTRHTFQKSKLSVFHSVSTLHFTRSAHVKGERGDARSLVLAQPQARCGQTNIDGIWFGLYRKRSRCAVLAGGGFTLRFTLSHTLGSINVVYKVKAISVGRRHTGQWTSAIAIVIQRWLPMLVSISENSHSSIYMRGLTLYPLPEWESRMSKIRRYHIRTLWSNRKPTLLQIQRHSFSTARPWKIVEGSMNELHFVGTLKTGAQRIMRWEVSIGIVQLVSLPRIRTLSPKIEERHTMKFYVHLNLLTRVKEAAQATGNEEKGVRLDASAFSDAKRLRLVSRYQMATPRMELFSSLRDRHRQFKVRLRSSTRGSPGTCLSPFNPSTLKTPQFQCAGVRRERSFWKRSGWFCIHGLWGPYFWSMPNLNTFVVWNFPYLVIDPTLFITYYNMQFRTGIEYWPSDVTRLRDFVSQMSWTLRPQYPSLLSFFEDYPLTMTLYWDCVHVTIMMEQIPPIPTSYSTTLDAHSLSYVANSEIITHPGTIIYRFSILGAKPKLGQLVVANREYPPPQQLTLYFGRLILIMDSSTAWASNLIHFRRNKLVLTSRKPSTVLYIRRQPIPNIRSTYRRTPGHAFSHIFFNNRIVFPLISVLQLGRPNSIRPRSRVLKSTVRRRPTKRTLRTPAMILSSELAWLLRSVAPLKRSLTISPHVQIVGVDTLETRYLHPMTTVHVDVPPYLHLTASHKTPTPSTAIAPEADHLPTKTREISSRKLYKIIQLAIFFRIIPRLLTFSSDSLDLHYVYGKMRMKSTLLRVTSMVVISRRLKPHQIKISRYKLEPRHLFTSSGRQHRVTEQKISSPRRFDDVPHEVTITFIGYHFIKAQRRPHIVERFIVLTFRWSRIHVYDRHRTGVAVFKDESGVVEVFSPYKEIILTYAYRTETGHTFTKSHARTLTRSVKELERLTQRRTSRQTEYYQFIFSTLILSFRKTVSHQNSLVIVYRQDNFLGIVRDFRGSKFVKHWEGKRKAELEQVSVGQLLVATAIEAKHTKIKLGESYRMVIRHHFRDLTRYSALDTTTKVVRQKKKLDFRFRIVGLERFLAVGDGRKDKYLAKRFEHTSKITEKGSATLILEEHVLHWMLVTQYALEQRHVNHLFHSVTHLRSEETVHRRSQRRTLAKTSYRARGWHFRLTSYTTEVIRKVTAGELERVDVRVLKDAAKVVVLWQIYQARTSELSEYREIILLSRSTTQKKHTHHHFYYMTHHGQTLGSTTYTYRARERTTLVLHRTVAATFLFRYYKSLWFLALGHLGRKSWEVSRHLLAVVREMGLTETSSQTNQEIWDNFANRYEVESRHHVVLSGQSERVVAVYYGLGTVKKDQRRRLGYQATVTKFTAVTLKSGILETVVAVPMGSLTFLRTIVIQKVKVVKEHVKGDVEFTEGITMIVTTGHTKEAEHVIIELHSQTNNIYLLKGDWRTQQATKKITVLSQKMGGGLGFRTRIYLGLRFQAVTFDAKRKWEMVRYAWSLIVYDKVKSLGSGVVQYTEKQFPSTHHTTSIHLTLFHSVTVVKTSDVTHQRSRSINVGLLSWKGQLKTRLRITGTKQTLIRYSTSRSIDAVSRIIILRESVVALIIQYQTNEGETVDIQPVFMRTRTETTSQRMVTSLHYMTSNKWGLWPLRHSYRVAVATKFSQDYRGLERSFAAEVVWLARFSTLTRESSRGDMGIRFIFGTTNSASYQRATSTHVVGKSKTISLELLAEKEASKMLLLFHASSVQKTSHHRISVVWWEGAAMVGFTTVRRSHPSATALKTGILARSDGVEETGNAERDIRVIVFTRTLDKSYLKTLAEETEIFGKIFQSNFRVEPKKQLDFSSETRVNLLITGNTGLLATFGRLLQVTISRVKNVIIKKTFEGRRSTEFVVQHARLATDSGTRLAFSVVLEETYITSQISRKEMKKIILRTKGEQGSGHVVSQTSTVHITATGFVSRIHSEETFTGRLTHTKKKVTLAFIPRYTKFLTWFHARTSRNLAVRHIDRFIYSVSLLDTWMQQEITMVKKEFPMTTGNAEWEDGPIMWVRYYHSTSHTAFQTNRQSYQRDGSLTVKLNRLQFPILAGFKDSQARYSYHRNSGKISTVTHNCKSARAWTRWDRANGSVIKPVHPIMFDMKSSSTPGKKFWRWPFITYRPDEKWIVSKKLERQVRLTRGRDIKYKMVTVTRRKGGSAKRLVSVATTLLKITKVRKYLYTIAARPDFQGGRVDLKQVIVRSMKHTWAKTVPIPGRKTWIISRKNKAKTFGTARVGQWTGVVRRAANKIQPRVVRMPVKTHSRATKSFHPRSRTKLIPIKPRGHANLVLFSMPLLTERFMVKQLLPTFLYTRAVVKGHGVGGGRYRIVYEHSNTPPSLSTDLKNLERAPPTAGWVATRSTHGTTYFQRIKRTPIIITLATGEGSDIPPSRHISYSSLSPVLCSTSTHLSSDPPQILSPEQRKMKVVVEAFNSFTMRTIIGEQRSTPNIGYVLVHRDVHGVQQLSISYIKFISLRVEKQRAEAPNTGRGFDQVLSLIPNRGSASKATVSDYGNWKVLQCRLYRDATRKKGKGYQGFGLQEKLNCPKREAGSKGKSGWLSGVGDSTKFVLTHSEPSLKVNWRAELRTGNFIFVGSCKNSKFYLDFYSSRTTRDNPSLHHSFLTLPNSPITLTTRTLSNVATATGHDQRVFKLGSVAVHNQDDVSSESGLVRTRRTGVSAGEPIEYRPHGMMLITVSKRKS